MPKQANELTTAQKGYVAARLTTTIKDAAAVCGVSLRTASRWEALPQVQVALKAETRTAIDKAATRAVGMVDSALSGLENVATDELTPPGVKVTAWRYILDTALRLNEQGDLSERLTRLEAILHSQKDI